MNRWQLLSVLETELASFGFASDPKPARKKIDWTRVRKYKRARPFRTALRSAGLTIIPSLTKEYHTDYRRAQRQKWLLLGIVKPKNDEERAWLAQQEAA